MPEIGQTISHYRIVEKIGQGGMGEVYLAEDLTLDRKVALKFLPDAFTSDPERMARFEREAKLLASLNHPNIAGIYGLEQADGNRFLVLEYVEGETLQARLSKGALSLEDALVLCRQIAEGLEAAHEKGVIHRDLKPANVMITAEEKVKILDFGLAKAFANEQSDLNLSNSPTMSLAATQQGIILGTAEYMSPEQARGRSVDRRADIWAFGVVFYEMLTGKQLYTGETVSDTLASVLKEVADLSKVPVNVRLLMSSCLEKDPSKRLRDIGDAWRLVGEDPGIEFEMQPMKQSRSAWLVAIVSLVVVIVLSALYFLKAPAEEKHRLLEVNTPPTTEPSSLAISPDGSHLVFVGSNQGTQQLWLRPLGKRDAQPLPGTEDATFPFWSPDSRSIGFFAGGQLKKTDIKGGLPLTLAAAPSGLGGTWNRDDVIVFTPNLGMPLFRVSASEREDPVAVTQLNQRTQTSHIFPYFLPDGKSLLYFAWGTEPGIYLASLDSPETRFLIPADSPAIYADPGYLLYLRQRILFARPFDFKSGTIGDEMQVDDSVVKHYAYNHGGFSASDDGLLIYRTISGRSLRQLVWFDRSGNEIEKLGEPLENLMNPELSPDYRQVAFDGAIPEEDTLILLTEISRGITTKFTNEIKRLQFAVWSPDSSQMVFSNDIEGVWELYKMAANGSGKPEKLSKLLDPGIRRFADDWSQDERFLLYTELDPETGRDLMALNMTERDLQPIVIADTPSEELNGQFSHDGQWVAYQSDEKGMYEIYVQSFPALGTNKRILIGRGTQPRWHPEDTEIYYIAPDDFLMAVPIHVIGSNLSIDDPIKLFPSRIPRESPMDIMRAQYDVAPDGRFLINVNVNKSSPSPITFVTNWVQALKR